MSWIKLLLSGLIVLFCVVFAYFASDKYRLRRDFYMQFARFNEQYLTELRYRRKTLKEMISVENCYHGDFLKTLEELLDAHAVKFEYRFLSKDEQSDGRYYFSMIGKGDANSQIGFFASRTSILADKKSECENIAREKTELYLKLGLLAGLAFVILII